MIFIFVIIFIIFSLYLLNQDTDNAFSKKIKDNTPILVKNVLKDTLFFIPVKLRELEKLKIENEKLKKLNNRLDLENLSLKNQLNFGKTNTRIITSKNKYRVVEYILPFFSERFENEQIGYFSEKNFV